MDTMQNVVEKLKALYQNNSKLVKTAFRIFIFYICIKLYKKWKYSQKLFNSSETNTKAILITGCDTGFGNKIALKLSIEHNYRVIATCLRKESVEEFLSNSSFTSNNSTAAVLDVTNKDNIESTKQYVIKYLSDTNATLWAVVNNAGFFIPGSFEVVPQEMEKIQWDVLFYGPLNIIRTFLPLLPGRKNYKTINNTKTYNNGGRIVNIASIAAHLISDTRYGPAKKSISYMSHVLRMELSPRFGIWVSSVEPGMFGTNIWKQGHVWTKRIMDNLKENNKLELADIYGFKETIVEKQMNEITDILVEKGPNIDMVVDNVIHGLIGKYPQRVYKPGWFGLMGIISSYAPLWLMESFMQGQIGFYNESHK